MTLIEVLIGMSTGLVVAAAAFTLLELSLHLYTRVSSRVDAGQSARVAMASIVDELQSSCVNPAMFGVQSNVPASGIPAADANHLVFVSQPNSAAAPSPTLHYIALSGSTLTDYSYTPKSGAPLGPWTFPSTATSSRVLATNVTQTGYTPVFQYFAYGSDGEIDDGTNGTTYAPLDSGSTLTTADAANTAEVLINFSAGPLHSNPTINDAVTNVSTAVVLRLTPSTSAGSAPCQ